MALQIKDITLGDAPFLIKESHERMDILDKKTGEGCVLLGNSTFDKFDKAAIRLDLTEQFKNWHGEWDISINDIVRYISKQREEEINVYMNVTQQKATIDFQLEADYIKQQQNQKAEFKSPQDFMDTIQLAKKAGYVQGVCECVVAIGDDHTLGKKLLSEMNVTKDTAAKYANPETFKILEQGIFAPQQKLEQTHIIKR
jgi:transglutaminase/protease-like cytokinesis protein 3